MNTLSIALYQSKDLFRAKWLIGYALVFFLLTESLMRFAGSDAKVLVSLANVSLMLVPLVSLLFGALHLYQSKEFIELLLAQPIRRKELFWGLYLGLIGPLSLAFLLGTAVPLAMHGLFLTQAALQSLLILAIGLALTCICSGLGFVMALAFFEDRIKGLGAALVSWLFLGVLYDGLLLLVIWTFGDYALDRPVLVLTLLNPIDLARIAVMISFEISALMGYTGAVFSRFFGSQTGLLSITGMLVLWLGIPLLGSARLFHKKDF